MKNVALKNQFVFITFISSFFIGSVALAQSDKFDKFFGENGVASFETGEGLLDTPGKVLTLASGRILVVSNLMKTSFQFPSGRLPDGISIVAFDKNGKVDTSFGSKGQLIFRESGIGASAEAQLRYGDAVGFSNNEFLVSGSASNYGTTSRYTQIAMRRYLASGEEDTTFGDNGIFKKVIDIQAEDSMPDRKQIIMPRDDGYLVKYRISNQIESPGEAIFKLNLNGEIDATFGHGKNHSIFLPSFPKETNFLYDLLPYQDGYLMSVLLIENNTGGNSQWAYIAKLNSDFTINENFGKNGWVASQDRWARVVKLIPSSDGGFFTVHQNSRETSIGHEPEIKITKYFPDGSLNEDFGKRGVVNLTPNDRSQSVNDVFSINGKIVVTFGGKTEDGQTRNAGVSVVDENGKVQKILGAKGALLIPQDENGISYIGSTPTKCHLIVANIIDPHHSSSTMQLRKLLIP
ncbi:MAG: hypothetical protein J0L93_06560 [Deltaproteobacteria bacterium]|nr:hypothetical protein [Deltaproteobacteria bacterium]